MNLIILFIISALLPVSDIFIKIIYNGKDVKVAAEISSSLPNPEFTLVKQLRIFKKK